MKRNTTITGVMVMGVVVTIAGCSPQGRKIPAVPEDLASRAQIPYLSGVRAWGDGYSPEIERSVLEAFRQRKAAGVSTKEINALTISGGGADGAYGAGILCGWTVAGNRPVFDFVTGVSTGALIAPFAFLGSGYDRPLRDIYLDVSTKDILKIRSPLEVIFSDSGADTEPLKRLLDKSVTPEMVRAVAREHNRGRRLFIGTTNLDAQRPVIWDMGAIAASGRLGAIELFRKVMLASASIPVAFPPQYFDVEADGQHYQEMHVDGGSTANVFHVGQMIDYKKLRAELKDVSLEMPRRTYLIRNGLVRPDYQSVKPKLIPIAGRSVATMLKANNSGDMFRIYALCKIEGMEFNIAYIPDEHHPEAKEIFDKAEMAKVFDLGFRKAVSGTAWSKTLPRSGAAQAAK